MLQLSTKAPRHVSDMSLQYVSALYVLRVVAALFVYAGHQPKLPQPGELPSRMQVNGTVREEITANQKNVPAGASQLFLNGAPIDVDSMDTFTLLDRYMISCHPINLQWL